MKKQWTATVVMIAIAMVFGMFGGVTNAADRTWTGDGGGETWQDGLPGHFDAAWSNATPDSAIFGGTAETVTLGGDISVSNLTINGLTSANRYTITGSTLNFATGGTIAPSGDTSGGHFTDQGFIESAITGAPSVDLSGMGGNRQFAFNPAAGSVTLGAVSGGNNGVLNLGGSTTSNTLASASVKTTWNGTGASEWTLTGTASAYEHFIRSGTVIISTGTLQNNSRAVSLESGATLHYNNPAAVYDFRSTFASDNNFDLEGGSLDNSSGAAITTSTYDPDMTFKANWTFIGSGGAASDLYLGDGRVLLAGTYEVTVQNSAATLSLGGVIQDGGVGYGLTKGGAGTLELAGDNTYSGNTTVNAGTLVLTGDNSSGGHMIVNGGTLSLGDGTDDSNLNDGKDLRIAAAAGATVALNFAGTDTVSAVLFDGVVGAAGTWGRDGHATADYTTNALTGDGLLYSDGGVLTDTYLWDGGDMDIVGDGDGESSGGAGTWNTATSNWDIGYVAHTTWGNTTEDEAILGGSANAAYTVNVAEPLNIKELFFETRGSDGPRYTIEGGTLNFGADGMIRNSNNRYWQTITSAITGSPAVNLRDYRADGGNDTYNGIRFAPNSGTVTLGAVLNPDNTGNKDKSGIALAGSTTGNTVASIDYAGGDKYGTVYVESGAWTVGDIRTGTVRLSGGTLIANGSVVADYGNFVFTGGTLAGTGVVNEAVTVPAGGGTIAPGDPTGALTVTNNNCTIAGTLAITINGAQVSTLAVDSTKTLDITDATLTVNATTYPSGPVVIVSYGAGNLVPVGGPFAVDNTPAGWNIDYGTTAITLTPPPTGTLLFVY